MKKKRWIFEESGKRRPAKEGEWVLVHYGNGRFEPFRCDWDSFPHEKDRILKMTVEEREESPRINDLMDADPDPGIPKGDELELLVTLAELYEKEEGG